MLSYATIRVACLLLGLQPLEITMIQPKRRWRNSALYIYNMLVLLSWACNSWISPWQSMAAQKMVDHQGLRPANNRYSHGLQQLELWPDHPFLWLTTHHFSGSFYEVSEDLLAGEPTDARLVAFVEGIIQEGALGAVAVR